VKLHVVACGLAIAAACGPAQARRRARNVVIFVADGLRPGSLNSAEAPTFVRLQREGVFFANSHSLFPTVTTANASAIATGHQLGDTGDFANTIYTGTRIHNSGTPFIEDDEILADLDAQTDGNYLGETSLLAVARAHGFSTAAVGKVGPTLIQDAAQGSRSVPMPRDDLRRRPLRSGEGCFARSSDRGGDEDDARQRDAAGADERQAEDPGRQRLCGR
jgi:arylsulfatase A-like enzyme